MTHRISVPRPASAPITDPRRLLRELRAADAIPGAGNPFAGTDNDPDTSHFVLAAEALRDGSRACALARLYPRIPQGLSLRQFIQDLWRDPGELSPHSTANADIAYLEATFG